MSDLQLHATHPDGDTSFYVIAGFPDSSLVEAERLTETYRALSPGSHDNMFVADGDSLQFRYVGQDRDVIDGLRRTLTYLFPEYEIVYHIGRDVYYTRNGYPHLWFDAESSMIHYEDGTSYHA